MRKLGLFFVLFAVVLSLTACVGWSFESDETNTTDKRTSTAFRSSAFLPRAARKNMYANTPSGEDSYSQGWRDGCDTLVGVVGSGLYQFIPAKIYPQRLTTDQWYLRGYQDGSSWCTFRLDWYIM